MSHVTGCQHLDNGSRRIYTFSDNATVVESPALPGKLSMRFYDARNRNIYDRASRSVMKRAVEQHKKRWGIK